MFDSLGIFTLKIFSKNFSVIILIAWQLKYYIACMQVSPISHMKQRKQAPSARMLVQWGYKLLMFTVSIAG